uniref:Uncharacterized protein n=1 Tax=Fibrocapsa japonica TaxID=94617 RepID=A0A7S2Y151_9STRA
MGGRNPAALLAPPAPPFGCAISEGVAWFMSSSTAMSWSSARGNGVGALSSFDRDALPLGGISVENRVGDMLPGLLETSDQPPPLAPFVSWVGFVVKFDEIRQSSDLQMHFYSGSFLLQLQG